MSLAPNQYLGLWEGPIDRKASSVINAIFEREHNAEMLIGDAVHLQLPGSGELLPRVDFIFEADDIATYIGIAVAGDAGGIYPESGGGFQVEGLHNVAVNTGDGILVVTQGRCVARVNPTVNINTGDPLTPDIGAGLVLATSGKPVVARALQFVAQRPPSPTPETMVAVDLHREGIMP